MDSAFWQERWETGQIGFHAHAAHPLLTRHWPGCGAGDGARVLVPLCGKSLDMDFLKAQGCQVTGIELSPIAIRQYLDEHGLSATQSLAGNMPVYNTPGIRLIEGDFFQLDPSVVGPFDAVYDRAALIAMPPAMQPRYASHLLSLTPATAHILLITLDYEPAEMQGPPFATPPEQVERMFGQRYRAELLEELDALTDNPSLQSRGLTALTEAAWRLVPR